VHKPWKAASGDLTGTMLAMRRPVLSARKAATAAIRGMGTEVIRFSLLIVALPPDR